MIHAQASLRSETAELAQELNNQLQVELGTNDKFIQTFASTGTEATEIAIKNALLFWQHRKENLKKELRGILQNTHNSPEEQAQYTAVINEIETTVPVLLSLSRSYHGKTASAVLSSSNDYYKKMYPSALFESIFLNPDHQLHQDLQSLSQRNRSIFFKGRTFQFTPFIGFIFEPIQGEGGIRPISKDVLEELFLFSRDNGIPTIADEIQSGLYRTGRLLVCADLSLQPDMILLGKSLGGGIAKVSVMACRNKFYVRELGVIHSSTFAEDDYSSLIALKTIQYLHANKQDIQIRANQFETDIKSFFNDMKSKYPRWIKDVRGKGFFIGIEFNFLENITVPTLLYSLAVNGHASYLLTSFLLNRHFVRVGVTLSSPETIRIEPSAFVTTESVQKLKLAFTNLLEILETNSLGQLFSHIFSKDEIIPDRSPLTLKHVSKESDVEDVAFLGHIINWDHAQRLDPSLRGVKADRLKKFFTAYAEFSKPFRYHQQIIESVDGKKVRLNLFGLTVVSDFFENDLKNPMPIMVDTIQDFIDQIKTEGISYLGLGQFTSIVTRNGTMLDSRGIAITTGNSLTAGFSIEALEAAARKKDLVFENLNIGLVGFAGNIGRAITQVLAQKGSQLTLVYKEPYETSQRFQLAVEDIVKVTKISKSKLHLTSNFNDLKNCDMVLLATNSVQELLQLEHLKPGCVVVDISVPSNVSRAIRSSKEVRYVPAGLARLPGNQSIDHSWLPLLSGDCFACLAETLVLGLSNHKAPVSMGDISIQNVNKITEMANRLGFKIAQI